MTKGRVGIGLNKGLVRSQVQPAGILLLGYSSIVRRRVLPALAANGLISADVGSESATSVDSGHPLNVRLIQGYDAALVQSEAPVVYVSTVNGRHFEWAERALKAGRHVIVDKPACLSVEETNRLVNIAKAGRLCLAEANVYAYHPRFQAALEVFREAGVCPTHITSEFRFPPLNPENFRYYRKLGGGALWDLGPYAVSPARYILSGVASEWVCVCVSHNGQVDTDFSVVGVFSGGRTIMGSFGFTTAYVNRIAIAGSTLAVEMDRAFSPPPDLATTLLIHAGNRSMTRTFAPADAFGLFLTDVFRAISSTPECSKRAQAQRKGPLHLDC